jgi:hypothetical protein
MARVLIGTSGWHHDLEPAVVGAAVGSTEGPAAVLNAGSRVAVLAGQGVSIAPQDVRHNDRPIPNA